MQGDVGPQGEVEEEAELRDTKGQRAKCKMALTHTWRGQPPRPTQKHTLKAEFPYLGIWVDADPINQNQEKGEG